MPGLEASQIAPCYVHRAPYGGGYGLSIKAGVEHKLATFARSHLSLAGACSRVERTKPRHEKVTTVETPGKQ